MQFYLAPLEGVTGYIVRTAFHHNFGNIDKYFTPFLPAAKRMQKKMVRDVSPENNPGMHVIPQVLSNKADEVIDLAKQLSVYGYSELNVNLGCPSGTVVGKKRGSGLLYYPDELEQFLDELYTKATFPISIKTRIGFNDEAEWEEILPIYEKYPMTELIIHPRTQKDFYKGTPRMETFATAVDSFKVHGIRTPLCYNGDIVDLESFTNMTTQFPTIDRTMIGRGLLAKPGLVFLLKDGAYPADYRERLRAFHDEIYDGYCRDFSGEKDALFHMKEIWGYMADSFVDSEKPLKQIRKSQTVAEYKPIANYILSNLEIQ